MGGYSWQQVRLHATKPGAKPEPLTWRPYRAVGPFFAFVAVNLGLRAWMVSLLGGLLAWAGLCLLLVQPDSPLVLVVCALAIQADVLLDFVDGTVARVRGSAGVVGKYVDDAVHGFAVGRLMLPVLGVDLWLETHQVVFLGLVALYVLRGWFVQWHEQELSRLLPVGKVSSDDVSDNNLLAWLARGIVGRSNDFINMSLIFSSSLLLDASLISIGINGGFRGIIMLWYSISLAAVAAGGIFLALRQMHRDAKISSQ